MLLQVHNPHLIYPQDVYLPFLYLAAAFLLHTLVVRYLLTPLSEYLVHPLSESLQKTLKHADSAVIIQHTTTPLIQRRNKPTSSIIKSSSSTNIKHTDKQSKFVISGWRFVQYSISVILGVYTLYNQHWTFDPDLYFQGWPNIESFSNLEKFYYQYTLATYTFNFYDLFTQPKQKDFPVMLLHHIVSFFLVYISYTWGAFRIGAVILLLHDLADPFMELAKCFLYAGKQLMADILFATFAAVFIFTRNYIFPLYVITSVEYSARNELGEYLPSYAVNRACLVSLGVLEVLHIYWAVLITKSVYKAIITGKVEGDIRDKDD